MDGDFVDTKSGGEKVRAKVMDRELFWSIIIGLVGCAVAALVADYLLLTKSPNLWWLHPAPILEFLGIFGVGYLCSRLMSPLGTAISLGAVGLGLAAETVVHWPALGDGFVFEFSLAVLGTWIAGNALGAYQNGIGKRCRVDGRVNHRAGP